LLIYQQLLFISCKTLFFNWAEINMLKLNINLKYFLYRNLQCQGIIFWSLSLLETSIIMIIPKDMYSEVSFCDCLMFIFCYCLLQSTTISRIFVNWIALLGVIKFWDWIFHFHQVSDIHPQWFSINKETIVSIKIDSIKSLCFVGNIFLLFLNLLF
jgi:hypothetical protein